MALSTRAVTLKASNAPNLRAVRRAGARRAAAITTRCDSARAGPSRVVVAAAASADPSARLVLARTLPKEKPRRRLARPSLPRSR
jgi:hypothetical protein